jgi:phosphoribosylpyrophosphate synthetase
MNSKGKVLAYLKKYGASNVHTLAEQLHFSRQYIHKLLNTLEEEKQIHKSGLAPHVFYNIQNKIEQVASIAITHQQEIFLAEHFIIINEIGKLLEGFDAMQYWCKKQNLPVGKTLEEYIATRQKYLNYYNDHHLIDGIEKLKTTKGIGEIGVDQLFYLDFYAIERFGKTRLGTLMHYAKQGQNKMLMKRIVSEIKNSMARIIQEQEITAVVFVPPTIKRQVQIMSFLEKHLALPLPQLKVTKLKSPIVVPQKALSKIFERVANAKHTFIVPIQAKQKHVLIIDDAIGSGATINEIALKIREKKLATKITGLAITGSFKGFEVISEL